MTDDSKLRDRFKELARRSEEAEAGGGAERREREHKPANSPRGNAWPCC
jgi:hypothetical protein